MACLSELLAQLRQVDEIIRHPDFDKNKHGSEDTINALCRNFEAQIHTAQIGPADSSDIAQALAGTKIPSSHARSLITQVISRGIAVQQQTKSSSNTQCLLDPLQYMPESIYTELNGCTAQQGTAIVGRMARSLDLHSPNESTVRALGALACTFAFPTEMPTPLETLACVQNMKAMCKASKNNRAQGRPTVWVYPSTPAQLPPRLYAEAYPSEEDPPR